VPIIAQTFLFPTLGLVWQGRYGMPLTVGVVLIAGIALDETPVFDRAIAGRLMRWCLGGSALDRDHRRVPQPAAVRHRQRGGGRYELLWQPTAWQPPGGNALSFGVLVPGYLPAALSLGRLAPPSVMENAPEPHRGGPEPATEVPSDFDDEEKAVPTSHSGELPQ
jgi:hypothetical protein